MSARAVPIRPRLADHVAVRRHVVAGDERIVLHDQAGGGLLRLSAMEWTVLSCADGTRDLDGITLAAARTNAYLRDAELRSLMQQLATLGMLADGIRSLAAAADPLPPTPRDRPLDVLAGYGLHCDGTGGCCSTYGSILFAPIDADRARVLFPKILDGESRPDGAFTPDRGGSPGKQLAVAIVDGHCAYLADNQLCAIHSQAGSRAKPLRCRLFPATLVDDGEAVRVSAMVECSCVIASAGKPEGEPLVPAGSRVFGDLEPGTPVRVLPETIAVTRRSGARRTEFVRWSRAAAAIVPEGSVHHAFWALAGVVESHGLEAAALAQISQPAGTIAIDDLRPFLAALEARLRIGVESDAAWKSPRDRSRIMTQWVADAVLALRAPAALEARLTLASEHRDAERFYWHATLHGHHAAGDVPLVDALRDRALRVLVARGLPEVARAASPNDPAVRYPLAAVEAVLRGQRVSEYVKDLLASRE